MDILPVICLTLTFISSLFLTKWWIIRAKRAGLVSKDMHKPERTAAEIGGLPVLISFLFGILLYTGYRTFFKGILEFNLEILAAVSTITIIAIIGIMDDILGWKLGLKQWQKPLLCLFAALPVMMTNIGQSSMLLPLIGEINLGLLYPLLIVPIAISFAANGFNMLAGYNGLEASMGIIILTTLGFITWFSQGFPRVAMLAFVMVASLTAFLAYNKYPARIFPGNTLTYTVGALIAIIAILGDIEKIALLLFLPYLLEIFLKATGKFRRESFAKPSEDGSLELPYKRIYSLEHLTIAFLKKLKRKAYEKEVVYTILALETFLAMSAILITI
tara:strand:+ start:995 stop:1987 length:993 start_codon:yes stop_codon:yes gene_type:complete